MGRDSKSKKKHRHSHRSRKESSDSDSEDDYSSYSSSSSDSETDSSSYTDSSSETSSSEEERRRRRRRRRAKKKARRRSSEASGRRRHSSKAKRKVSKKEKIKEPKAKKPKKVAFEEISMDDYFLRSAEFRTWLSKEKETFFSDLSSEESRKLFKKFADKWNAGNLDESYYQGIQSSAVGHDTQSNFQWKFSSKVSSGDLKAVRDSVSEWSSSKDNFDFSADSAPAPYGRRRPSGSSSYTHPSIGPHPPSRDPHRMMGPARRFSDDTFEREERRERERSHLKADRRDFRKRQEMVLDELLPKATGKEARVEKKKIRAEQRREREVSPDLGNSDVYGSSTSSIRDKVKARQEERKTRADAAVQKISDYQAKEKAKMEAMLQMAKANKKEGALW